ncbi:a-type inclusion protein [Anaeramoeba flamelloides]|uniref:A-type inclusion protein n=1 Tax=Anaeramoeba flamelloides TaxID=1746091 RepID=A0ABQ8YWA3_9EUKA|nr:a-type inclusion protein [Anaeramoeba flamelloides]
MSIQIPDPNELVEKLRTRNKEISKLGKQVLEAGDETLSLEFETLLNKLYSSKDISTRKLALLGSIQSKTKIIFVKIYKQETSAEIITLATKTIFQVFDGDYEGDEHFFQKIIYQSNPKICKLFLRQIANNDYTKLSKRIFREVYNKLGIDYACELFPLLDEDDFNKYKDGLLSSFLTKSTKKNVAKLFQKYEEDTIEYISMFLSQTHNEKTKELIFEKYKSFFQLYLELRPSSFLKFAILHVPPTINFPTLTRKLKWLGQKSSELLFQYITEKSYVKDLLNNSMGGYPAYWIGKHVRYFTYEQKKKLGGYLLLTSLYNFFAFLKYVKPSERGQLFQELCQKPINQKQIQLTEDQLTTVPRDVRVQEATRILKLPKVMNTNDFALRCNLLSYSDISSSRKELMNNIELFSSNPDDRGDRIAELVRCTLLSNDVTEIMATLEWLVKRSKNDQQPVRIKIWDQLFWLDPRIVTVEMSKLLIELGQDLLDANDSNNQLYMKFYQFFILVSDTLLNEININNKSNRKEKEKENKATNEKYQIIVDEIFVLIMYAYTKEKITTFPKSMYCNSTINFAKHLRLTLSKFTSKEIFKHIYPDCFKLAEKGELNKLMNLYHSFRKFYYRDAKRDSDLYILIKKNKDRDSWVAERIIPIWLKNKNKRKIRVETLFKKFGSSVINIESIQPIVIKHRQDLLVEYNVFESPFQSGIFSSRGSSGNHEYLYRRYKNKYAKKKIKLRKRGKAKRLQIQKQKERVQQIIINRKTRKEGRRTRGRGRRGGMKTSCTKNIRSYIKNYGLGNELYDQKKRILAYKPNSTINFIKKVNETHVKKDQESNKENENENENENKGEKGIKLEIEKDKEKKKWLNKKKKLKKQRRKKRKNLKKNKIQKIDNIITKEGEDNDVSSVSYNDNDNENADENDNKNESEINHDNILKNSTGIDLKSDLEKLLEKQNISNTQVSSYIMVFKKNVSLLGLDSNLQRKYMYGLLDIIIKNKAHFNRYSLDVFKTIIKCSEFNMIFFTHFIKDKGIEEKIKKLLLFELSRNQSISTGVLYLYQSYFDTKYLTDITPLLSYLSTLIKKAQFNQFLLEYIEKPKMKLNLLKEIIRLVGKLEPEKSELLYYKLWNRKNLHKDIKLTLLESKLKYLINSQETWKFFNKIIDINEPSFFSIRNWFINHSPHSFNINYSAKWVKCLIKLLHVIENDDQNNDEEKRDAIIHQILLSVQDFLPFLTDGKVLSQIMDRIKIYINSSFYTKSSEIAMQLLLSSLQSKNMWKICSKILLSIINELIKLSFIKSKDNNNLQIDKKLLIKLQSILQTLSLIRVFPNNHQKFFNFMKEIKNSIASNNEILKYIYPQYIFMITNFSKFDRKILEKAFTEISTLIESLNISSSLELLVEQVSKIAPVGNWISDVSELIIWFNHLLQSKHVFFRYYLLLLINQFTEAYGWESTPIIKILKKLRQDECSSLKYLALNTTPYNEILGKKK